MKLKIISVLLIVVLFIGCQSQKDISNIDESDKAIELNPAIQTGQLKNGVTYFIQENEKPENRIELRLIVNTGSIQENDNQRGLAHFIEHMAFNGTKNFQKDRLVKYLESLGMGFGPEINAYTSFDETVYKLSIPADDPEVIENAFQILEDWAHQISLDDDEIEKERGVIVEEWRGGRGVQGRYLDKLFPVLLKDSRYPDRLPIGDMDVIKNCDPQELRNYYNEWYRPELIAVAVVGSIENINILEKIQKHFNFTNDFNGRERITYETPIQDRTAVEIIQDPEMTYSDISIYIKKPLISIKTEADYRSYINEILTSLMFNSRMEEIYTKPNSPFLNASTGTSSFVRDISMSTFSSQVAEGGIIQGFKALVTEIEKVKQNGFNQDELDRAKSLISMIITQMYNERDNVKSTNVISEIVSYYLNGNIVMNISDENVLLNGFLPNITLEEVNKSSLLSFSGKDRTVTIHVPENKNIEHPKESELVNIMENASKENYDKRLEEKTEESLFNHKVTPGTVVDLIYDDINDITTIILNNGAEVILKPTDFKDDEINFSAISFGGLSLVKDDEFLSGSIASNLVKLSGLNGFDSIKLNRILTGKNADVSPWIGNYTEGLSGGSNIEDKEIMFQMINLYFTHPEFSPESYEVLLNNIKSFISNRENSPKTIFNDRVKELLGSSHFRSKPVTLESLNDIDLQEIEDIYTKRFSDPGDFKFVFTGNFDVQEILPLILTYIGSISTTTTLEQPMDVGIRFPNGVVQEVVSKGIEEQSLVEIVFNGEFKGSEEDEFAMKLLSNYLQEELRVLIREEMSGTYGVSVFSDIRLYPVKKYMFGIYFGCEPGRENELSDAVFSLIDKARNGDMNTEGITAVINNYHRSMELKLKENRYWLSSLVDLTLLDRDYDQITDTDTSFITADKFVRLIRDYLNNEQFVKVILKPE